MRKRIYLKEAIESTGTDEVEGSKAELARVLGITRQAIQQWNPRKPIASIYVRKLKALNPMKFANRE